MAVENTILEDVQAADERKSDIPLRFILMAVNDFARSRSVEQYAQELEISRSKLNDTLFTETGYTASKLLDNKLFQIHPICLTDEHTALSKSHASQYVTRI